MSLRSEIHEQPDVLRGLLERQAQTVREIARDIHRHQISCVYLAARGTSDNAGRYAQYAWGGLAGLPVALASPSLFTLYRSPPRLDGALVVAISQSGQSPDIVAVVEEGRRQGRPTLTITNDPESPLARAADLVLDLCAGAEHAVAATKTYTTELMAVAMLAAELSDDPQVRKGLRSQLGLVPRHVDAALSLNGQMMTLAKDHAEMERCVVLGRGYNLCTAHEWALKLKEMTGATAEPYSPSDFQHGPVAVVDEGFPVFAVAPSGAVLDDTRALLSRLASERGANVIVFSDDEETLALAAHPVRLPADVPEWLSPLVAIVPAQLFCYHLARARGWDTETPGGLSKVTRTV